MLSFLVRETRLGFSCRSSRSYIGSPWSFAHLSITFPLLRRPTMVIIPLWVACWWRTFNKLFMIMVKCSLSIAADIGSPRSFLFFSIHTPGILISLNSLLQAYWSRGWYVRRHPCNKAHHWSRFCCDSFFSWILLKSFLHHFRTSGRTEMDDIEQAPKMIPLVTCEISFGQYVCELVFGVDVLDLEFFGSKLIRSNSHSSAPLWFLETCLIVGLLPLLIILITASLSSNTYNKASWCENCTFEGTQSMWFNRLVFPWDLWPLSLTTGLRARIKSNLNPASKEMISDSVELCETEVCFLHIQLIETNVWLPKMHSVPPEVDFESSRSPAKSESWNSPSLQCCAVLPTSQYCRYSLVWWIYEIKRAMRLTRFCPFCYSTRKLVHRPWNIKSPNTSQMSISEQFVSKLQTILVLNHFFFFKLMVRSQVRSIFPHISLPNLPCHSTKKILFLQQVSLKLWSVVVPWPQQKSWIRTYLCCSPQYPCWFDTLFECNPHIHGQEVMLVHPNRRLSWVFPSRFKICCLACHFDIVHIHW